MQKSVASSRYLTCALSFVLLVVVSGFYPQIGKAAPIAVVSFISAEVSGSGLSARQAVDTLNDSWETATQGIGAATFAVGTIDSGSLPVVLTTGVGFTAQVSVRDMDGSDPLIGAAASNQGGAGSTTSTTMQDTSPKPQSLYSSNEAYFNETGGSGSSPNGLLFTFSSPIRAFGAWFGDVETRTDGQGTAAILRLIDESGAQIGSDITIPTSTTDQSLCGAPVDDGFAGCGNETTRWIGFVADAATPVKQMLVIVGDDDTVAGSDNGNSEHLSFIGAQVGISPSAVSLQNVTAISTNLLPLPLLLGLLLLLGITAVYWRFRFVSKR